MSGRSLVLLLHNTLLVSMYQRICIPVIKEITSDIASTLRLKGTVETCFFIHIFATIFSCCKYCRHTGNLVAIVISYCYMYLLMIGVSLVYPGTKVAEHFWTEGLYITQTRHVVKPYLTACFESDNYLY